MNSKEIRRIVEQKLRERQMDVFRIKSEIEILVSDIQRDLKTAGGEVKSLEEVGMIIIDVIDEQTNTGLFDPIDGPVIKAIFKKLLQTKLGQKIEEWYQSLRSKL